MFKKLSVIIVAVIQLIFCLSLSLYNPVVNHLTEKNGEIYYFDFGTISYNETLKRIIYNDDTNYYLLSSTTLQSDYFVIETDENGISHLSFITEEKPKDAPYIRCSENVSSFDNGMIFTVLNRLDDYNLDYSLEASPDYYEHHAITVAVKIYNGYSISVGEPYIDGIPIYDFLEQNNIT